jgi:LVIVD repeat
MRRIARFAPLCAFAVGLFALTAVATADPGEGHGDGIPVPTPGQPNSGPGIENMTLLDAADKDGTINSDIAFMGNKAYVGNYDGFRIFDISDPSNLQLLSDTKCRANQGDLSVFKASDGREIMLQSIDRPVTVPDCSAVDTPTTMEDEHGVPAVRARFGFEGLRMFDVSDPRNPKLLRFYRTECGSHTHTLVPDNKNGEVHAYVPSYPLLSQITPQIDRPQSDALGLTCDPPHSKISIVSIPLADPEEGVVHKQPLASNTEFYDNDGPFHPPHDGEPAQGTQEPFQACHDFQVFEPRNIVVGACAGDLQYWSIKDRGDPTSEDGEPHTLIQREVAEDDPATPAFDERWQSFDFVHNSTVTWDGRVVAAVDESGGGVQARCDGSDTKRGFTFFYPLVKPGKQIDAFEDLLGTYMIPRPQGAEECVSHNGNVLPTDDGRYLQVQAFYKGGNTLFDFTDPSAPQELAFSDLETNEGNSDSWSSYWYNDVLYVNGGLDRGGPPPPEDQAQRNRGFEAFALFDENGDRIETRDWKWLNPQTQESWQVP